MYKMITEETLKRICNVFIGDEGDYFSKKSGPQIISFFNGYFKQNDIYGQGFPSRWLFVYNKLVKLINEEKIDDFFTTILSVSFMMKEHDCTQVEASEWVTKTHNYINKIISKESYSLARSGKRFFLIEEDTDFELIGSGGFADVYFQKSTGKVVKKLKEDFWNDKGIRSRFKREFRITKELNILPGIITVFDFDEGKCSYSMERAEMTLYEYIEKNEFELANKIKIIRIVLNIMKSVHEMDIIHRDLSPNNIFIIHGHIKLADFGLGKDLNMFTSHQTIHTNSVGQYYYCAPEQFMMLRDGDKRSDVYSLGRIINYVMTESPVNSHHCFRSVAEKATNDNAAYRYGDAMQLLNAFEKSVEYNAAKDKKSLVLTKIESQVFDDTVESFIYELSAQDICRMLISETKYFDKALIKFMKISEDKANYVIQSIDSSFRNECNTFESNDPIAHFAYCILTDKFGFTVNEIAANILRCIAYDVNRFYAQRLVDKVIEKGVEPLIEERLR